MFLLKNLILNVIKYYRFYLKYRVIYREEHITNKLRMWFQEKKECRDYKNKNKNKMWEQYSKRWG